MQVCVCSPDSDSAGLGMFSASGDLKCWSCPPLQCGSTCAFMKKYFKKQCAASEEGAGESRETEAKQWMSWEM